MAQRLDLVRESICRSLSELRRCKRAPGDRNLAVPNLSLLRRGRPALSSGETLAESDPGDFMAILVDGMAKILKEGDDNNDHLIAEIGAGACVGEMALVDGGSRSASVIVSKETTMLVLTVDAFAALGQREPKSGDSACSASLNIKCAPETHQ